MSCEIPLSGHENNNGWDQDTSTLIPFDESACILLRFEVCIEHDYSDFEDDYFVIENDTPDVHEDSMYSFSSEPYSTSPDLDANDLLIQLQVQFDRDAVSPLHLLITFTLNWSGSYLDDLALRIAESLSANEGPKPLPASQESIENLEKVKFDQESSDSVCSVCLETISIGSEAKRMPCSHIYHGECIVEWLMNSNTCPICRYQMPTES